MTREQENTCMALAEEYASVAVDRRFDPIRVLGIDADGVIVARIAIEPDGTRSMVKP